MESDNSQTLKFQEKKLEGNYQFKNHNYSCAISLYSTAICLLETAGDLPTELGIVYNNRALCQLRLQRYEQCVDDTTSSLKINPSDVKALYRRALALQRLNMFKEAIEDVRRVLKIEPTNPDALALGNSLNIEIDMHSKESGTINGLISISASVLMNQLSTVEDKESAAKKLAILSRDNTGAYQLMNDLKLGDVIDITPSLPPSSQKHILQALAGVSQWSAPGARTVIQKIGYTLLRSFLIENDLQLQNAAASVIYHSLSSLLRGVEEEEVSKENIQIAEEMSIQVLSWIGIKSVAYNARDLVLESLLPTVSCRDMQYCLMKYKLVETILLVASSSEVSTGKTRGCVVSLFHNFFKSVSNNKQRLKSIKDTCFCLVMHRMKVENAKSCLEGLTILSTISQVSPQLGSEILGNEKILSVALGLLLSDNEEAQVIAAENVALAASDKEHNHCLVDSIPALKVLCQSNNPEIRVRALVGICKIATLRNQDNTLDLSAHTFEQAYHKFLTEPHSPSIKRWAMEGLTFLSVSAPVKEYICKDKQLLHSVLDLISSSSDTAVQYGASTLLVNLTNSYDQPDRNPELEELAHFSGENVPTPHELDSVEYVTARISLLLKLNIVPALNHLSSSLSVSILEQTARVFLALVEEQSNRGIVVQQGGGKALIKLARSNTEVGKCKAAQAISKIAITMNPQLAFPGERVLETISPLVRLLKSEQQLQQFESLMALTNLSSLGTKLCHKIVSEKGVHWIESLQFEEHEMLRRAATECICNLVVCEEVKSLYRLEGNDRLKLLLLFSGEEDSMLRKAASGALCVLSEDQKICELILNLKQYFEITEELLGSGVEELQFRAVYILTNIVLSSRDCAERILNYDKGLELFEVCSSKNFSERIRGVARASLEQLISYGLVKGTLRIQD